MTTITNRTRELQDPLEILAYVAPHLSPGQWAGIIEARIHFKDNALARRRATQGIIDESMLALRVAGVQGSRIAIAAAVDSALMTAYRV